VQDGGRGRRARTPEGTRRFEGEHVISTMPLRSLVRSLEPRAAA
jgi:hypothetical protein